MRSGAAAIGWRIIHALFGNACCGSNHPTCCALRWCSRSTYASTLAPGFKGAPFQFDLVFLLQHLGYLNGFFSGQWLNVVFWTLALEFQFYLLVGMVFPGLNHTGIAVRLATCAGLLGCAIMMPQPTLVFRSLTLFLLGIWAFQIRAGLLPGRALQLGGWLGLATAVGCLAGWPAAIASVVTALLIVHVRIRWRPLLFLGQISYSLYLLHVPVGGRVINLGARFADSMLAKVAVLMTAVGVCLAAAYLFHRWVELPAQRWAAKIRYTDSSPRRPEQPSDHHDKPV